MAWLFNSWARKIYQLHESAGFRSILPTSINVFNGGTAVSAPEQNVVATISGWTQMLIQLHVGFGKHPGAAFQGHHKAEVTEALFTTANHIPFLSKPGCCRCASKTRLYYALRILI